MSSSDAIDLVISLDTTSSMHSVLALAKQHIASTLTNLFAIAPAGSLRVGIIVHGDYDDLYETRLAQLTDRPGALANFLTKTPRTCGLDYPECYELVLRQAATRMHWRPTARRRLLVLLGDAVPHEPGSRRNKYGLDWRAEAKRLADMSVSLCCVDCGGVGTGFYGFAREMCGIFDAGSGSDGGVVVPYRGWKRLERTLVQLLAKEAPLKLLAKRYRLYHRDSQEAEAVPTAKNTSTYTAADATTHSNNSRAGGGTAAAVAAAEGTENTTSVARACGLALSQTANWTGQLLTYLGFAYLIYALFCVATSL